MRTIIATLLAAAAVSACAQATGDHSAITEAEAAKVAIAAEVTFTGNKLDAIMTQYDDKAVMIDANVPEPSDDRKITTGWARTFVSMKPADYKVTGRRIQLLGPDAFVSSGIESFTVAAGVARPTVSARFTDVFQRKGGAWKIVHEHVSMPPVPAPVP